MRIDWTNELELRELAIADLTVDERYQRGEAKSHVKRIVRDFRPVLVGAILVAEREDGSLAVVDGQQRVAALRKMDIETVLALVHRSESMEGEAKYFVDFNTGRKNMRPFEIFYSDLASGDEEAHKTKEIAEEYGFYISDTGRGQSSNGLVPIRAVTALRTVCRGRVRGLRSGESALHRTMEVLSLWRTHPAGRDGDLIAGLGIFFIAAPDDQLDLSQLHDRLERVGPFEIRRRAAARVESRGGGGRADAVAETIRDEYNRGRRCRLRPAA